MAGKKSPKKSTKSKSPKKDQKEKEPKFVIEEETKKKRDYSDLVNIPKHGWIKLEVGSLKFLIKSLIS